jgi:hypothetical protein
VLCTNRSTSATGSGLFPFADCAYNG